MKICAYEVREDERNDFETIGHELGLELELYEEVPCPENAWYANGCDGVTFLGQGTIDAAMLDAWKKAGIKYAATRTVGYNHIDVKHAAQIGIKVCNAAYPPSGVAEFTIMLMLMSLRQYKQALWRGQVNDFSLAGLQGRELRDMTVGIMGTGRIGKEVIKILQGFSCRLLAYSPHPSKELKDIVEYVSIERLYAESDVITLHMPLTDQTYHMINRDSIAIMKDGVVIINCARGELADMDALIKGIETGKIGALGLDVVEGEEGITHVDHRIDILANRNMAYLRQFRNVVMTPHMAFYTGKAVHDMVNCALYGMKKMQETGTCETEIH